MITPPPAGLGKIAKSSRGLEQVKFKDALGVSCVLQSVTLAYSEYGTGLAIGAEKASPKVQARDARAMGLNTSQKTGLVKFPVPEEVSFDTRAVLTREQVKRLVEHLNGWLAHNALEPLVPPAPMTVAESVRLDEAQDKALAELSVRVDQPEEGPEAMEHSPWTTYDEASADAIPPGPLLVKNSHLNTDHRSPTVAFHWRPSGKGSHLFGRPGESSFQITHWRPLLPDHPVADWWRHQDGVTRAMIYHGELIYSEFPPNSPKVEEEVQHGG